MSHHPDNPTPARPVAAVDPAARLHLAAAAEARRLGDLAAAMVAETEALLLARAAHRAACREGGR